MDSGSVCIRVIKSGSVVPFVVWVRFGCLVILNATSVMSNGLNPELFWVSAARLGRVSTEV